MFYNTTYRFHKEERKKEKGREGKRKEGRKEGREGGREGGREEKDHRFLDSFNKVFIFKSRYGGDHLLSNAQNKCRTTLT